MLKKLLGCIAMCSIRHRQTVTSVECGLSSILRPYRTPLLSYNGMFVENRPFLTSPPLAGTL